MAGIEPAAAATEAPVVERLAELTPAARAMLGELVAASHWNQTADDWAVFFDSGTIYVIREAGGRIIASGAVLPMGASRPGCLAGLTGRGVAWISMILVLPEWRGRGLGRGVFDQCVRHVRAQHRIAMLDATPAGEALYKQFGFEVLWRLTRWRREASPATRPLLPAARPDIDSLAELDQEALGFSRTTLLRALLARADSRIVRQALGFGIVRAGRVAHHIGPLVATNERAAIAVLQDAAARYAGPLLIDVPDERPLLRQALLDTGFTAQRGFARMALATAEQRVPQGQTHFIHAVAGPEFA
ncbi:GNAT family N-acetyltransferase [Ramlibacter sp.]|uniref:GNAT family N-acetyltransferase n=1 Tax=Ramlibacter sp. TaxID=1917967 RepID=UPI002B7844BC|nr:GNAT family N-acetyltransferase [Ramlibacter sp.]HWI84063.1 GNAT family N-acetyltransferase [Ramlibacter sp.]